mgnify:CR=1 FL=1
MLQTRQGRWTLLGLLAVVLLVLLWQWYSRPRPATPPPPGSVDSVRIATWNLKNFTKNSLGDLRAIARVIEQSQFDVIAIQEIQGDATPVDRLLNTLNPPDKIVWRATSVSPRTASERFVFLYRADKLEHLGQAQFLDDPWLGERSRRPYVASFRAGSFDFTLITVHFHFTDRDLRQAEAQRLAQVATSMIGGAEKDIIVLGDFNEQKRFGVLQYFEQAGFERLISEPTNLGGTETLDNIVINTAHTREFASRSGVVRFDEMHFANDDEAAQRNVSDHRPAYADFSAKGPDDD